MVSFHTVTSTLIPFATLSFISVDLTNGESDDQQYLVLFEIQREEKTSEIMLEIFTVKPGEGMTPKLEWIPNEQGMYEITNFILKLNLNLNFFC